MHGTGSSKNTQFVAECEQRTAGAASLYLAYNLEPHRLYECGMEKGHKNTNIF
jgi:hypothetical protein